MAGRHKHGYEPRPIGWGAPVRSKPSRYAAKGYLYEVRLTHELRWPRHADPTPFADLIEEMKRVLDCRVVGQNAGHTSHRRRWSIRVYLKTDADLFALRLLTNGVFRVYQLRDGAAQL